MQFRDTYLFFSKKKNICRKKINMNRHILIFKYIIYNLNILIFKKISIEMMPKKKIQKRKRKNNKKN